MKKSAPKRLTLEAFTERIRLNLRVILKQQVTTAAAKRVVDAFSGAIRNEVLNRLSTLSLPRFGTFYPKRLKARTVNRPPGTDLKSKTCAVPPQIKVGFRAGKLGRVAL